MSARWMALLLVPTIAARAQQLPAPAPAEPTPADHSLTARFEDDLATQEWTLIKSGPLPEWKPPAENNPLPLTFFLTDAATGARVAMNPAAYFTTGERQRWGGRTLGVDWVLVLDGASNELLRVSGQWKASTPRILRVEAGLNLPLRTWTWHEGPHQRVELQADTPPCSSTHATPLGSGRQARYPISVLSQPDRAFVLEAGLAEPGTFITVADAARDWWGLQTDFALDARTTRFPGRAAFAFTLRTQPHGGPNAFRQAWQELQTRQATPSYAQVGPDGLRTDEASLAATAWPLIFLRDEGTPGAAQSVPFDLMLPAPDTDQPDDEVQRLRVAGWRPLGALHVREPDVLLDEYGSATSALRHVILRGVSSWPRTVQLEIPPTEAPMLLANPATGAVRPMPPSATGTVHTLHLEPDTTTRLELFGWPTLEEVRAFYRSDAPATTEHQALVGNLDSLAKLHALEIGLDVRSPQPAWADREHPVLLRIYNHAATDLTLHRFEFQGEAGPQPLLNAPRTVEPAGHADLTGYLDPASLRAPASWLTFLWTVERQGARVDGAWTERLEVAEPLWTRMPTQRVVTLDENVELPVQVWNRTELPQTVILSSSGDFDALTSQHTLTAGEQRVVGVTLTLAIAPTGAREGGRVHAGPPMHAP
jgi:hypothetical protein